MGVLAYAVGQSAILMGFGVAGPPQSAPTFEHRVLGQLEDCRLCRSWSLRSSQRRLSPDESSLLFSGRNSVRPSRKRVYRLPDGLRHLATDGIVVGEAEIEAAEGLRHHHDACPAKRPVNRHCQSWIRN